MHIRDGILSPEVCAVTAVMGACAVGYSLRRLRSDLEDRAVPLTGMMAAAVFAGQMVNFPLIGLPVSGHLLGGVLAATIVGPWAGCLAITLVLLVQAMLFNDGGLLSLGANILNMGVVGSWGGYAIYDTVRRFGRSKGTGSVVPAAMIAAWTSVLASAALFCIEFACSAGSNQFNLSGTFALMVLYHAFIGVGEALITGAVLGFVLARRSDLIAAPATSRLIPSVGRFVVAGMVFALAIAAFLAPWKSDLPDGLDAVSQQMNFASREVERDGLVFGDYAIPALDAGGWSHLSTSTAGVLGTSIVFAIAVALGAVARWNNTPPLPDRGHAS